MGQIQQEKVSTYKNNKENNILRGGKKTEQAFIKPL